MKETHVNALPLYVTGFAAFIGLYLPQPLLPHLAEIFSVSAQSSSLIISLTILGIGLAAPFVGVLSDSLGRKRILTVCSTFLAVFMIACALSPSFSFLLLFRFLQGLCLPGLFVVAVAYTSEVLDKAAMTKAAGIYVAMTVIGGMLGRLLGGAVTDLLSWRLGFAISGLFYLGLVFLWIRQKESEGGKKKTLQEALKGTLSHFQNYALVAGLALGFCLFFAFQSTFTYLPFKLKADPFGLSSTLISLTYLSFIAGMISSSFAGQIRQKIGLRSSFLVGFSIAVLGNIITLSFNLWLILLGLIVICFGNWLVQGLAVGFVATATQHDRAGANALYLLFYYLGGSLGGYLPGFSFDAFGYSSAVAFSLLLLGVGMVCTILFVKTQHS